MSAIELEVQESFSDICPHCEYVHEPWEGSSEMWSDRCMISCFICDMPYYYLVKDKPRTPDWEL